jgi:hypothetical protein
MSVLWNTCFHLRNSRLKLYLMTCDWMKGKFSSFAPTRILRNWEISDCLRTLLKYALYAISMKDYLAVEKHNLLGRPNARYILCL